MIQRSSSSLPPVSASSMAGRHRNQNGEGHIPEENHSEGNHITPRKHKFTQRVRKAFAPDGPIRPFRLLTQDLGKLRKRYVSDWTIFNQLIFASAVFVFFTNLLPGITFASDLYQLTGKNYGTIEVVLSTGICGIIYSM